MSDVDWKKRCSELEEELAEFTETSSAYEKELEANLDQALAREKKFKKRIAQLESESAPEPAHGSGIDEVQEALRREMAATQECRGVVVSLEQRCEDLEQRLRIALASEKNAVADMERLLEETAMNAEMADMEREKEMDRLQRKIVELQEQKEDRGRGSGGGVCLADAKMLLADLKALRAMFE